MATLTKTSIDAQISVTIELTESEMRALDGLFGYDVDGFLKVFYEKMGQAYLKPHEGGIRSLHCTVRAALAGPIATIDAARKAVREQITKKP